MPSGAIDVYFQLQVMVSGPRDVGRVIQDGAMQVARSGQRVPTKRRNDLELSEQPPRP